ncbi:hypothetical protein BHM03_00001577 [Ensete ventricosum]|nr:hypothetical protein BHM03_00001577 [Ensete ventricosum]
MVHTELYRAILTHGTLRYRAAPSIPVLYRTVDQKACQKEVAQKLVLKLSTLPYFPRLLRRGEGDEEKIVAKKSSPREVLQPQSSSVAAQSEVLSLFLPLLPLSLSFSIAVARLIPLGSRRRWWKLIIIGMYKAVRG